MQNLVSFHLRDTRLQLFKLRYNNKHNDDNNKSPILRNSYTFAEVEVEAGETQMSSESHS